jgi:adenosine deaminase
MSTGRDMRALPKAHLHLHLEAAMREATVRELAGEIGIDVPKLRDFEGFTEFDAAYQTLFAVLRSPDNVARLIDEAVADAAAQGAVYVELGVVPEVHAPTFGGSPEAALEAMLDAAASAAVRHGVEVGAMPTVNRQLDADYAAGIARLAAHYAGRGVVSLGLAYEERGFPADRFGAAFRIARDAGLLSAPHAGELVGPESVRAALDVLAADRIQHGVRSVEDPALLDELAGRGTCLDVCPTSNLLLGVVGSLAAHPLPALLAAGVRCSINADDPLLFDTDLLTEYERSRDQIGLSDEQLAACALSSVQASGASDALKRRAATRIDSWLSA